MATIDLATVLEAFEKMAKVIDPEVSLHGIVFEEQDDLTGAFTIKITRCDPDKLATIISSGNRGNSDLFPHRIVSAGSSYIGTNPAETHIVSFKGRFKLELAS